MCNCMADSFTVRQKLTRTVKQLYANKNKERKIIKKKTIIKGAGGNFES